MQVDHETRTLKSVAPMAISPHPDSNAAVSTPILAHRRHTMNKRLRSRNSQGPGGFALVPRGIGSSWTSSPSLPAKGDPRCPPSQSRSQIVLSTSGTSNVPVPTASGSQRR